MAISEDLIKETNLANRRGSTSTIDSETAAEIIRQYGNITDSPISTKLHQTQSNSLSPKVQNTMTFDKSDGIHVGDVINYYCSTPNIQVPNIPPSYNTKSSITQSNSTLISSTSSKNSKFLSFFSQKLNIILLVISLILTIAIISGIYFMMRHKPDNNEKTETTTIKIYISTSKAVIDSSTTSVSETTTSELITTTTSTAYEQTTPTIPPIITLESFVNRTQWNAEAPRATVELKLPIYRIIIAHTASAGCNTEEDCTKFVQELQGNSTNLDDIPYNFLIGNDSKVYEGRGFLYEGQHTSNNFATEYNSIGICVAFIGNYEDEELSESQIKVFNDFVDYFMEVRVIHENHTIFSQDQLTKTEVPASALLETIETWKGYRKLQKIYHREDWGAENPMSFQKFDFPMDWALITSTGEDTCKSVENCTAKVRELQMNAFNQSLDDIPFGFVISEDGSIFEGRGWDYVGQHTTDYDTITVAIGVIGFYGYKKPSPLMLNATLNLLEDGAALGKLTSDYKVNGRQELGLKLEGPGASFVYEMLLWKHWNYIPKSSWSTTKKP